MLYGTLPFKGLTPREIKDRVLKGNILKKKSVSETARGLIDGMLNKDVSKRMTIEEVLHHEWFLEKDKPPVPKETIFNHTEQQAMIREFFFIENRNEWPKYIFNNFNTEEHDQLF